MSITPLVVTFDGVDIAARLSSLGARFRVLYVEGAGLHGAEVTTERQPGLDGSRLVDSYLPERVVTVGFAMRSAVEVGSAASESQSDAERELNGIMAGRGLAQLELSHIVGWHFMAKAGGVRVSTRAAHYMEGELSFVCPSPFLRETAPTEVGFNFGGTYTLDRGNTAAYPTARWTTHAIHTSYTVSLAGVSVTIDRFNSWDDTMELVLDWDRMRFSLRDGSTDERLASAVASMSTFVRPELHPGESVSVSIEPGQNVTIIPNARRI